MSECRPWGHTNACIIGDEMCGVEDFPPPPPINHEVTGRGNLPKLSEAKMAIANAVEDYASAHLHAFIKLLINLESMTESDVLKALEKFDESLQAPPGE